MDITQIDIEGYEKVCRAVDPESGLHALIAVHDTTLGPALGGMRMWPYGSEDEALKDVLRLSRGMTFKSAVADTGLGGGKSVIIGDPVAHKSEALFEAMGSFVESLGGLYITAEDVNTTVPDLEIVQRRTNYVTGLSRGSGSSGNPSPYTADGCVIGFRACLQQTQGSESFDGLTFAFQGAGAVGGPMAQAVADEGGQVLVADINPGRAQKVAGETGGTVVPIEEILFVECDVLSPCAMGAAFDDETIPELNTKVIAGCANNQLAEPRHADMLRDRGIVYAPDYVINAGGIINVSVELLPGGYDEDEARRRIGRIYDNLQEVFSIADEDGVSTREAAFRLAKRRLAQGRSEDSRSLNQLPTGDQVD